MSRLLRFTEFVKAQYGSNHASLIEYFNGSIADLADECNIDWQASKGRIIWDGQKNGGAGRSNYVIGKTPDDKGRVYIFAKIQTYNKDGVTFTYPYISFQNMRNSLNKPNRQFNGLTPLFEKYNEYKISKKLPKRNTSKVSKGECLANQKQLEETEKKTREKQIKVQTKEPKKFASMLPLSHPKAFSPYLKDEKQLQHVAEQFDIRVGKNHNGYFTCFAITTVKGEFKGLQRIYHTPPSEWDDRKRNTWGVDTTGLCTVLGELNQSTDMIYLCEGLASGLAMYLATGRTVVVCLYAGNIKHVSQNLVTEFPSVKRVHVADNDNKTPAFGNTGVYECAMAVREYGGHVFVPIVRDGTDVCDLFNTLGLPELKRQIYSSAAQYFNGSLSQHVDGMFNYIHDRYVPLLNAA